MVLVALDMVPSQIVVMELVHYKKTEIRPEELADKGSTFAKHFGSSLGLATLLENLGLLWGPLESEKYFYFLNGFYSQLSLIGKSGEGFTIQGSRFLMVALIISFYITTLSK